MSADKLRRTGLIAKKVGMSQIFNDSGEAIPVTLLKTDGNYVVDVKSKDKHGYSALVLGFDDAKASRTNKPQKAIFSKLKIMPKKVMQEFRVTDSSLVQVGSQISVEHFVVNQKVDIAGYSTGKGFAGGMKRHNFRGLEASHGVSISHRSHGSTGNRQDPGRTFPGKKMAGHLGDEKVTLQNITIADVNSELGIIAVHGSVPGKNGSYVSITDAIKVAMPGEVAYPAKILEAVSSHSENVTEAADLNNDANNNQEANS
jgi:large subunit ribosomal protein L3